MQLKENTYRLLILLSVLWGSATCATPPAALGQNSETSADLLLPIEPSRLPHTDSSGVEIGDLSPAAVNLNPTNYFQFASEPDLPQLLPLGQPFINSNHNRLLNTYPSTTSIKPTLKIASKGLLEPMASLTRSTDASDSGNTNSSPLPNLLIKDPNFTITSFQEPVKPTKQALDAEQETQPLELKSEQTPERDTSPQLVAAELSLSELAKRIQGRIELINSNNTLDDKSKQDELIQLNLANQIVKETLVIQKEISDEEKRRTTFPIELKKLNEQLNFKSPPNSPNLDHNSKQIETELKHKKQERDELKSKQSIIDDKIEELAAQMATNPTLKTEILKELKETKEKFLESQSTSNNDEARLIFDAKKLKSNKQLEQIGLETIKQEQLGALLPIKKAIIQRNIEILDLEIELWKTTFNQKQSLEISFQQEQAKQASIQAIQTDKSLAKIADENHKITQLRSDIALDIEECNEKFTAADQEYEEINTDLESIKDKIEMPGGHRQDRGIELVKLSRNLMHTFESQARIDSINAELRNCQLNELNLRAKLRVLSKRDAQIRRLTAGRSDSENGEDDSLPLSEFTILANELLDKQQKYSSDLLLDYQKLRTYLVNERERLIQLINKVNEAREYSAKNALWVRSTDPLSVADFKSSWTSIQLFFSPQQWLKLANNVSTNIKKRPYGTLFTCFLIMCAFIFSRRLRGDA